MTPPSIIENKTKNSEDVNGAVTRDMMQKGNVGLNAAKVRLEERLCLRG